MFVAPLARGMMIIDARDASSAMCSWIGGAVPPPEALVCVFRRRFMPRVSGKDDRAM